MKHLYILFPIFVLIITFSLNIYAVSTSKVYIEEAIKYENSENVTIKVCVENIDENIVTLGLDAKYDTAKLEYVSSKAGKDLQATLNLAEDITDESRVAIGIVSLGGLDSNGEYYYVTFKVKDDSSDIPIELTLREATDSKGNDVKVETKNGIIKMSSKKKKEEAERPNQKIEEFEINQVEEFETIENIITQNTDVKINPEDSLIYEVENSSIAEISNNGMIIPNQEGTTTVKVKLNGEDIGTLQIAVKDGKVQKVSANKIKNIPSDSKEAISSDEENEEIYSKEAFVVSSNNNNTNTDYVIENENTSKSNISILIIFVIIIFIFIIILIKKGRKKRKNEKIY